MDFKLWADEAMTTEFGLAHPDGRLRQLSFSQRGGSVSGVVYFGCPDASVKLTADSGEIVLSTVDALPQRGAVLAEGELFQPVGGNGYVYRVVRGGETAADTVYPTAGTFADGTARVVCLGRRHLPSAVRLALSGDALAAASSELVLGQTLMGGAAVAVWYRVDNAVDEYYDALSVPMLAWVLNDCTVSSL